MKIPSPPAIICIGLIIFSPTFFNDSSSENPFSELFEKDEKVPVEVSEPQDLLRSLIITKANQIRGEAEKSGKAKEFVVHRLYRISGEFSKFRNRHATIAPSIGKDFEKFQNLTVDWIATNYILYYLENGVYPDSVIDDSIKGVPLEQIEKTSLEYIQILGKNDGIDYLTKFGELKNVKK